MKALLRGSTAIILAVLSLAMKDAVAASDYPTAPIQLVVAYPPGGINDIVARIVGERLTTSLGQPVIVDNRAGAGGTLGATRVARAKPDGYTLLMGTVSNIVIAPNQYKNLAYDPLKDFIPVVRIGASPNVLLVNPDQPVETLADFIALAKRKPGEIGYASAGIGGTSHLTMELLTTMTGITLNHVPYKGEGPAAMAVMAAEVPITFSTLATALPQIKANKLRPLGVTSPKRSSLLPDVPTIEESGGLPGFDLDVWVGLFAPAGTPREIVGKLNAEIVKITKTREIRERLKGLGAEPIGDSPDEFATYIKSEVEKWARAAKASGIQPE